MQQTMRAVVAREPGGPEVLVLEERPVPEPGPGQVRIRVAYAALNPLDTHARAKRIEWNAPTFPFVPGYEFSGLVEAVGEGVDEALLGKRVVSEAEWGGCADYALATAARLVDIPDELDWQLGTVYHTCAYSAWHILHTAGRLTSGMHVLFHSGAGATGLVGTQVAKEAGAVVYGLCGSDEKVEWARQFGADHLINRRAVDWVEEVKRLSDGRGVDLIIDGVAGPKSARNFEALAPLGEVIYMGAIAGQPPPVDISRELYAKTIAVRGFVVYVAMAATGGKEKPLIHEALASGRWKIPITLVAPLEETAEIHRRFENRELYGKTLIEVGGDIG